MPDYPSVLGITIGSTNYSFKLAVDKNGAPLPVKVVPRPARGQVISTIGRLDSTTRLDNPWVMASLKGIGVSRAVENVTTSPDERAWEMRLIDYWDGMWCLAPATVAPTDIAGVHNIIGAAEAIGVLYYFADTAVDDRETLAYFVGSTDTWTSCTATADWKTTTSNAQFPCAGMAEFQGTGVANLSAVALRTIAVNVAAAYYQLMYSANSTTWTAIDHAAAADTPAGNTTDACTGLINILSTLYTLSYNSTTKVITLRQSTTGTTWTSSTGGTLRSNVAPRALAMAFDYAGVLRPFVYTREGAFWYTGTGFGMASDYRGNLAANNGLTPVQWAVDGVQGFWNVSQQERAIVIQGWTGNSSASLPINYNIAPTAKNSALPTYRDGQVTALASARNWLWAAIGGDASTTKAGIFKRNTAVSLTDSGVGWIGPLYHIATAERQIRRMWFSTLDDGVPRLHWVEDNGAAGDVNPVLMKNVTKDPRTVTSYAHTATAGQLILPKNSRGLPDLNGVWLKVTVTGTNLSDTNLISAAYAVANAAPIDADSGSWGSTLGTIVTSGGSVNFAATPTGSGQSAREIQLRLELTGASAASPYIEAIVVEVRKLLPVKTLHVFQLDLRETEGGGQGGLSSQKLLADLLAVVGATTYSSVTYGQESSVIMRPYQDANYIEYLNKLLQAGTGGAQTNIEAPVSLWMEEV